jgi:hypothetical protein
MEDLLLDIWCLYFEYSCNRRENLKVIRSVVEIVGGVNITIYNNQAKSLGLPQIGFE